MTSMRNRTFSVRAGLLTALSVGVVSIAGCTGFNPNPTMTNPTPGPAATTPSGGGTPSSTPGTTTPATGQGLTVTTKAMVGGVPLTNLRVHAVNAVTGANLVAAGAGNLVAAGAGNYVLTADDCTPADTPDAGTPVTVAPGGTVTVMFTGFQPGEPVTFTLTGENGAGATLAYNLKADGCNTVAVSNNAYTGSGAQTYDAGITDVSTTIATKMSAGMFQLMGTLTPEGRKQFEATIVAFQKSISDKVAAMPADKQAAFIAAVNDLGPNPSPEALEKAVDDAGVEGFDATTVNGFYATALNGYSTLAANKDLVLQGATPTVTNTFPKEFTVNFSAGTLTIAGPGADIEIDFNDATGEEEPVITPIDTPDTDTEEDEIQAGDEVFTTGSGSSFAPHVDLSHDGTKLTMHVTQGAGEDDVQLIVARINRTETGATFTPPVSGTLVPATTGTIRGDQTGTHIIAEENGLDEEVTDSVPLSARLGGIGGDLTTSERKWIGRWRTNGQPTAIVQIFERGEYIYVAMQYSLGGGESTLSNGGHDTTLSIADAILHIDAAKTKDSQDISANGTVDVDIYSRRNAAAESSEDIVTSSSAS